MGFRELVILLLGLLAVTVMLRGLYIAIQARRSQIRLAIDKNIPEDYDLEEFELAELPGGGARKVDRSVYRSGEDSHALESAYSEDTGFSSHSFHDSIPILMDPVEIRDLDRGGLEDPSNAVTKEEDFKNSAKEQADENSDHYQFEKVNIGESRIGSDELEDEEHTLYVKEITETREDQNTTFDDSDAYQERGSYEDEISNGFHEEEIDYSIGEGILQEGSNSLDQQTLEYETNECGDRINNDDEILEESPEINDSFEDKLGDFSMIAGERIGHDQVLAGEVSESIESEKQDFEKEESFFRHSVKSLFALLDRGKDAEDKAEKLEIELEEEKSFRQSQIINELEDFFDEEDLPPQVIPENLEEIEESIGSIPEANETTADNVANFEDAFALNELNSSEGEEISSSTQEYIHSSEVLVVNVMAKEGCEFSGDELLHVLVNNRLVFGEMSIFHRYLEGDNENSVIFSVANVLKPGIFDLYKMNEFSTIGVSLFLSLPSGINNLQAFEDMIEVAQDICNILDGELKDDHRSVMTAQTTEHYRQRIRDFELLQLKAAGSRS
ncbi:MAG: cell division protein ZipA [Gammaproteobacteria bacterium]|nr:cell division protein ZipA [Gammaproteobacteria bacterium]